MSQERDAFQVITPQPLALIPQVLVLPEQIVLVLRRLEDRLHVLGVLADHVLDVLLDREAALVLVKRPRLPAVEVLWRAQGREAR